MIDADGREAEDISGDQQQKPKPKPKPITLKEVVIHATKLVLAANIYTMSFISQMGYTLISGIKRSLPNPLAKDYNPFQAYGNLIMMMEEPGEVPEPPASTPVGKLGDQLKNLPSKNKPTTINGVKFTGHALDQMQTTGVISPTAVIDAIHTGVTTPGNSPNEVVHTSLSGDLRVVTDPTGQRVITVTPQSPTIHVLE